MEIFSSETGEWRKSVLSYSETKDYGRYWFHGRLVTYKGMLYWSGFHGLVDRMDPFNKNSTCTGVDDNNFHFTEFGKCVDDRINNRDYSLGIIIRDYRLGVWQGRLRMCELFVPYCCPTKYILCIWELKEEETAAHGRDKWCLIESASTDQMVSEDPLIANQRVRIYEEM